MKEFKDLKIAVAGTGYVGLSLAVLLAQHHQVTALDIVPEKVEMINNKKSPIRDEYIEKYLAEKELDLTATLNAKEAYSDADFVVIAAPTNYDSKKNFFDTSAVEAVIKLVIEYNPEAIMVIKSTIPVGFTASVREKYHCDNIIFSPEFLRESKALYDNLYPSRIIVGRASEQELFWNAAYENVVENKFPQQSNGKYREKMFEQFYHAIKRHNAAFERKIVPLDLLTPQFVQPNRDNPRILKQDGAFIISGLDASDKESDNKIREFLVKELIIPKEAKEQLRKELEYVGINQASLFPEVDRVADYLRRMA